MSQAESELNQSDMPAVEGSSPQPPTGEVPQTSQGSARAPTHGATRQQKKAPAKPNKTAQGPTPGVTAEALEGRLRSFRDEVGQQLQELGASIRDIIREEISRGIAAHPEQAPGAQGVAGTVIGRVLEDEYNRALEGVPIQLLNRGGQDFNKTEQSDANGAYCFDDVPPGDYNIKLEKEKITLKDGDWVSGENSKTEYHITVQESTPTRVPMFRLARDEHKIWGYLRTPNGSPLSGATIEIQNETGDAIDCTETGEDGRYDWTAPAPGTYYLLVTAPPGMSDRPIPVRVNPPKRQDIRVGDTDRTTPESVVDLTAYPIPTQEVSYPAAPRPATSAAPGVAPLGRLVEGTLREVLGWRPKGDDPRGFVGALTQSFALKEVEGHTEWTWTPRTYAVQTDLAGGITGAQASLYTRAKDALDQALPLLDGLYPLRVDADPQDMEALRATVHSQMTEIVNELGISGGPRVSRIDQLFLLLLGGRLQPEPGEIVTEPDDVEPGSQLGTLREEFGLATTDDLVNTVEEEQNLTNFRILADYLIGLRLSWVANRRFFTRVTGTTPFFGTQLVLLSRQLSVIVESVDEVRFALDSVFIGPSERQTLELVLGGREDEPLTRMFVEELLSWVSSFASEEGPRVIQDGGKHGVQTAFLPVVETLQLLVDGATHPANPTDLPLPKGYYTLRVQRSLQELRDQLKELVKLASSITHQVPPESTLDQINAQVKALQTRIDQFRRP